MTDDQEQEADGRGRSRRQEQEQEIVYHLPFGTFHFVILVTGSVGVIVDYSSRRTGELTTKIDNELPITDH